MRKEGVTMIAVIFVIDLIIYLCLPRPLQFISSILAFFIPDPFGVWNEAIKVGKVLYNFLDD